MLKVHFSGFFNRTILPIGTTNVCFVHKSHFFQNRRKSLSQKHLAPFAKCLLLYKKQLIKNFNRSLIFFNLCNCCSEYSGVLARSSVKYVYKSNTKKLWFRKISFVCFNSLRIVIILMKCGVTNSSRNINTGRFFIYYCKSTYNFVSRIY